MARPTTTYQEAEAIHADILTRSPEGCRLDRRVFEKLLVAGYQKSLDTARRITETGEAAGFWTRHRGHGPGGWSVEVHAQTRLVQVAATTVQD